MGIFGSCGDTTHKTGGLNHHLHQLNSCAVMSVLKWFSTFCNCILLLLHCLYSSLMDDTFSFLLRLDKDLLLEEMSYFSLMPFIG